MGSIQGSYRATQIATIAAAITLLDAQFTAENARMIVLGGAATSITGTLTMNIKCTNGVGAYFTHRISTTLNCPLLADTATLTAALSIFATALETESAYTTVAEVEVILVTTMTN